MPSPAPRHKGGLVIQIYAKVAHERYSIRLRLKIMKRKIYLEDLPLEDARKRFVDALEAAGLWGPLGEEEVALHEAAGRVTARSIWAAISAPHYHASAMDGYAVRAGDTLGASETTPLLMTLIQDESELEHTERPIMACNTGHPLPGWG